jgi:phosphoenolpyruvate-protein phosphotransferase (PTS system enzyme I)
VSERLHGLGVSAGQATGPALSLGPAPALPEPHPVTDPAAERLGARTALELLARDLDARAERAAHKAARDVLEAQALMARDSTLHEAVTAQVERGLDAAHALHAAFTAQADLLREAGGYLGERAADLDDLRNRAVAHLIGAPMPGVPDPGHPYILIADDLSPADTAALSPDLVLALVTARGGPTSHTAILARALALPAVVGCTGILDIADGTLLRVDGDQGVVDTGVPEPAGTADAARSRPAPDVADWSGPGRTADGHRVALLLNAGSARDAHTPAARHAEGVGLLRTELLFLGRHQAPTLKEQRDTYTQILQAFPGRKVVVRTLDAGADKPLPFLGLDDEPNPALGIRGLRTALVRPDVLDLQLDALAQAAEASDAHVWCMAPMVATPGEAAAFRDRAHAHGLPVIGAMVEIPAAALRARRLLDEVDFLSIGTNDLSQYTLAADRQCGRLADLLDPWQPALLDLIAACAQAGRDTGKPVGVCGEAAADPLLACVLTGLGITSLSMSAAAIAPVGARLARHTLADCEQFAQAAINAPDARTARADVARLAAARDPRSEPDPAPRPGAPDTFAAV